MEENIDPHLLKIYNDFNDRFFNINDSIFNNSKEIIKESLEEKEIIKIFYDHCNKIGFPNNEFKQKVELYLNK